MLENLRHRLDEIRRDFGAVTVDTLRKVYGATFAPGFTETQTLAHVLSSVTQPTILMHDFQRGDLRRKIAQASRT